MVNKNVVSWGTPSIWLGGLAGALVALGFTFVHDAIILDIWFNVGPMVLAGALIGLCLVWSYQTAVSDHTNAAWFRYASLNAIELIVLGAISLLILRPQFTMAELMVADDAFDRLLPPSMPLMIGAMLIGTIFLWHYYGRRISAIIPILFTQVLLVFFLGHQFAFLGLVQSSTTLLSIFGQFTVLTIGLAAGYSFTFKWLSVVVERLSLKK